MQNISIGNAINTNNIKLKAIGDDREYCEKLLDEICKDRKTKTLQKVRQMISDNVDSYWGDLLPYDKCSSEYSEGLKLIEGKKKYKFFGDCINNSEYRSQIIEKGAYADGEKAERLFDILKGLTI